MANELQVLELKVEKITPASIVSNVDKLEPFIEKVKEKYGNLVFTEDEKATAKEMRTNLNKLEKQISDERKKIEKEAKVEIDNIINTLKKAEKDVKSLSASIGEQIKNFDENEWKEKLESISEIKEKIYSENKLLEKYFVIDEAWKKKTMTLKKVEEDIKEKFDYWNKRYNFIVSQLVAVNEEIENKLKFEDIQYLMLEEYDNIMKKLVDKKNEIKTTEENIKRKAEEDKQKALAELEAKKEQEKREAIEKAKNETVKEEKTTNTTYFDTTIRFPKAPIEFLKELKTLSDRYGLTYELKENIRLGDDE